MGNIKSFNGFLKEGAIAQPTIKPITKPITKPSRPSPYRRNKPSVIPRPKASVEDIVKKFLNLTKNNKEVKSLLKEKYKKI